MGDKKDEALQALYEYYEQIDVDETIINHNQWLHLRYIDSEIGDEFDVVKIGH